jgi:hypothetical protein
VRSASGAVDAAVTCRTATPRLADRRAVARWAKGRRKIRRDVTRPGYIETAWGSPRGYSTGTEARRRRRGRRWVRDFSEVWQRFFDFSIVYTSARFTTAARSLRTECVSGGALNPKFDVSPESPPESTAKKCVAAFRSWYVFFLVEFREFFHLFFSNSNGNALWT